jgi:riboflavin kinase/FMN adenylyltransferase
MQSLKWTDPAPAFLTGGAVSVGNFDGVHRGHKRLIQSLAAMAKKLNGPSVAVTFDPPPVALLNPSALKLPLTTLPQRAELLRVAGADSVVVLRVDPSLLALSPEAFFEDVLLKQLGAKGIVEGSNFRFGRGRGGDANRLRELCQTRGLLFDTVAVDAISSSSVRQILEAGHVAAARELLGRCYSISGNVIEGAKRGQTIGVPTANLGDVATALPAVGVYAGWAHRNHQRWPAVANIGPNPTFGEDARKIEIHLLDFAGNLYGQQLSFNFVERLRDTRPFPSVDALKQQLHQDIAQARQMLGDDSDNLRSRVENVLRNEVAPALELDGRDIEVVTVENGIASIRLGLLCASCPSTISTLLMQLEAELRQRLPEIEILEAVA